MKKENEFNSIVDSAIDAQSKTVNNWIESTQKVQKAMLDGRGMDKGTDIYKEWLDNQMGVFKNISTGAEKTAEKSDSTTQDFYKNWYNSQMNAVKQLTDYNQNLYNTMMNFGKTSADVQQSFNQANATWTNLYNNWTSMLNNAYDSMSKNMNPGVSKDAFANMFSSNNVMFKMYELWQPMQKSFMNTGNPADAWKNIFDAAKYKEVMDNLFESLMGKNNVKELFDTYTKTVEEFFTSNNNLGKEYYANMQDMAKKMPELMSGDFAKVSAIYGQAKDVFEKAYAPLLKLVAPGKEKESIELTIAAMDKAGQYAVKQSELQYLMYTAGQKSMDQTAALVQNKMQNNNEIGSFQAFFNEWVGANEKIYLELFASEEFSKLKAEVLDLSLGLRKTLEKQFEFNFEKYPFVFKSEMEEIYKTMYDLKKTVKNMQAKFGADAEDTDAPDAKAGKGTKKAK